MITDSLKGNKSLKHLSIADNFVTDHGKTYDG